MGKLKSILLVEKNKESLSIIYKVKGTFHDKRMHETIHVTLKINKSLAAERSEALEFKFVICE